MIGLGVFITQRGVLDVLRPVFSSLPTISGTTGVGDVLTATYGTTTASEGGGSVSYAGQWYRDGVAISGATALNYTLVQADAGTTVLFTSTATDSNDSTSRSASLVIPAISGVTTIDSTIITIDSTIITIDGAA